jgi:hypothetical protein
MITSEEEVYFLERAYIPEHILNLMVPISKGEPFLIEDHLVPAKDNWLILVGYPLWDIHSKRIFLRIDAREFCNRSSKHSDLSTFGTWNQRPPPISAPAF